MASRRELLSAALLTGVSGCTLGAPRRTPCHSNPQGAPDLRMGFAGDIMLGRGVNNAHASNPPTAPWGDFLQTLDRLDAFTVNLECCLSTRGTPRPGRTYHFRADPTWAIPALTRAGVTFASLANNHTLDFGPPALHDTITHLDDAAIANAGAGSTRHSATAPTIITVGDLTIGFIAFTDRAPTYAATANHPGTAYTTMQRLDPQTRWVVRNAIHRANEHNPDLLIASLHWGPNWVATPSLRYRAFAHWLIDEGVDLIHGHSAHIIQGLEFYRGRPILHDTGDFIDDYAVKGDRHNDRCFLFQLELANARMQRLRLVPIEITNTTVTHAGETAASWLRARMRTLSEPFSTTFQRVGNGLVTTIPC